jgi:hypothetical protein
VFIGSSSCSICSRARSCNSLLLRRCRPTLSLQKGIIVSRLEMYPRRAQHKPHLDKSYSVPHFYSYTRYTLLRAKLTEIGRKDSLGKITPSLRTANLILLAVDHSVYALSTIQLPKHLAFLSHLNIACARLTLSAVTEWIPNLAQYGTIDSTTIVLQIFVYKM